MRGILATLVVAAALAATGCSDSSNGHDGRVSVAAAFYPLAEAAERVGGDRVAVTNLTPVGVEPHDVELTPGDVDAIADAIVVLYVGNGFQPNVARAARDRGDSAVDVAKGIAAGSDPHFWLDPTLMIGAVEKVMTALSRADRDHADEYRANAEQFGRELRALDERFTAALRTCVRRDLVTAHAAFGYLAKRYGLTEHAISGVSPEAEASPARLDDLERLVRERRVTTVFYEELVPRDFAVTLAKETGTETAVLNPLEGLTEQEQKRGDDYLSVMGRNRQALVRGLGCEAP